MLRDRGSKSDRPWGWIMSVVVTDSKSLQLIAHASLDPTPIGRPNVARNRTLLCLGTHSELDLQEKAPSCSRDNPAVIAHGSTPARSPAVTNQNPRSLDHSSLRIRTPKANPDPSTLACSCQKIDLNRPSISDHSK
jgi:hypothetical protein